MIKKNTSQSVTSISRRNFMKTTALTVGAVTILSQGRALADSISSSSSLKLICINEPSTGSYDNAWPADLSGALRKSKMYHTTDGHGEGINWDMYHWLEPYERPKRKEATESPGQMTGKATAHMVITRSFWTYQTERVYDPYNGWYTVYTPDQWVERLVAHLTAGQESEAGEEYQVYTDHDHEVFYTDAQEASNQNGCYELEWNGEVVGWAAVSYAASEFKLRSDAFFVPAEEASGFSYEGNLSLEISGIGAGASAGTAFNINPEPPHSPIILDWDFVVRENSEGIDESDNWTSASPGIQLPPSDVA